MHRPHPPSPRGVPPHSGARHPGAQGPFNGQSPHAGSYGNGPGERGADQDTDRHTLRTGRSPGARKRVLVAAALTGVLLAGAGTAYAVMSQDDGGGSRAVKSPENDGSRDADGQGGRKDAGRESGESEPSESGRGPEDPGAGAAAGGPSGGQDGGGRGGDGDGKTSGGGSDAGRPGADGGDGGTTTGGGSATGGGSGPEPACHPRGGGKHNCSVWKTAASYNARHRKVGQLNAGKNYFYCQKKLPHRETSGRWTNVWWAKTDDDSGNANVFVSVVYIRGGGNDEPVPGLPVC